MLFTVELFNAVAGVIVLTESVLVLGFVKDGVIVPVGSGLWVGSTVIKLALQNVDCTRKEGGVR